MKKTFFKKRKKRVLLFKAIKSFTSRRIERVVLLNRSCRSLNKELYKLNARNIPTINKLLCLNAPQYQSLTDFS